MEQDLTITPSVLAGIDAGTRYSLQNKSSHVLHVQHAASSPDGTSTKEAFSILPEQWCQVRKTSGSEIYIWVSNKLFGGGHVTYDEAA